MGRMRSIDDLDLFAIVFGPAREYMYTFTLQELILQGVIIRDVVVFSRYSRIICFANDLSIF